MPHCDLSAAAAVRFFFFFFFFSARSAGIAISLRAVPRLNTAGVYGPWPQTCWSSTTGACCTAAPHSAPTAACAVGETLTLLHPPSPFSSRFKRHDEGVPAKGGVSTETMRECQQNDSPADGAGGKRSFFGCYLAADEVRALLIWHIIMDYRPT